MLDPPEYLPIGGINDYIEFRHTPQVNEDAFNNGGYYIFYKIFDTDELTYDLDDLDDNGGVEQFEKNFKTSGALSLSNLEGMVNDPFNISPSGRYAYLMTIHEGTDIPDNDTPYEFSIKSSTANTLNSYTELEFVNTTLAPETLITVYRHYSDELSVAHLEGFGLDYMEDNIDDDDFDLPTTIEFQSGSDYSLTVAFIGVTFGTNTDPEKIGQRLLSEPEFLGYIYLDK